MPYKNPKSRAAKLVQSVRNGRYRKRQRALGWYVGEFVGRVITRRAS